MWEKYTIHIVLWREATTRLTQHDKTQWRYTLSLTPGHPTCCNLLCFRVSYCPALICAISIMIVFTRKAVFLCAQNITYSVRCKCVVLSIAREWRFLLLSVKSKLLHPKKWIHRTEIRLVFSEKIWKTNIWTVEITLFWCVTSVIHLVVGVFSEWGLQLCVFFREQLTVNECNCALG